MFSQRHLVRLIYLACFAVLMAALAPAVSQVLAAQQMQQMQEHMRQAMPHAAAEGVPEDCHDKTVHPLSNHCGYCVMQADLPYLPTLAIMPPAAGRPASLAPPPFRANPSPSRAWLAAQPRAPPAA